MLGLLWLQFIPADDNYDESLSTLQYASRAKKIQNKAKKNEDEWKGYPRTKERNRGAKGTTVANAEGKPLPASSGKADDEIIEEYQRKMAILEKAKQESWEEKEKMSRQFEEQRKNIREWNHIRDVMQTVKEENVNWSKDWKHCNTRKNARKEFKDKKFKYDDMKHELEKNMSEYNELMKRDANGDHSVKDKLEALLLVIEKVVDK